MEIRHILLILIVILVIVLGCLSAYILTENTSNINLNITPNTTQDNMSKVTPNSTDITNKTTNSTKTNTTNDTGYRVYNPQSDSYVSVIGESYDHEVNRWYTFDSDGVRYYNTRIN